MKNFLTDRQLIRYVSVLLFLSAFVIFFIVRPDRSEEYACLTVVSANVILQLYPLPSQSHRVSLLWSWAFLISVGLATIFVCDFNLIMLVPCIFLSSYLVFRCRQRFRKVRSLFCSNNIIEFVRGFAHLFYCSVLLLVVVVVICLWQTLGSWVILLPVLLFPLLYYRAYFTRTLFVSATSERQIYEISRGEIRCITKDAAVNVNDARMESIYAMVVDLMENKKVYLKSSYSIYDLAHQTGTNKSYISRVVNIYSGQNFCKFLNWYRIRYAAAYANENPDVRVTELALKSGFNSNVTFNAAFRMFMGCSPGDYILQIPRLGK